MNADACPPYIYAAASLAEFVAGKNVVSVCVSKTVNLSQADRFLLPNAWSLCPSWDWPYVKHVLFFHPKAGGR